MENTQAASVAGSFYPADPVKLAADVELMLKAAKRNNLQPPKAIIAPHAGYIYSGEVAASAYARWLPLKDSINTVVVLAPSHRVPMRGLATSSRDGFLTPLGEISLAKDKIKLSLTLSQVMEFNRAFAGEHALEVQLPFLQIIFSDFKLVPFIVGDTNVNEVAEVLELLWGDENTRIVISSDLSHFLDYETAKKRDEKTTRAIMDLDFAAIQYDDACGRNPVKGLLLLAKKLGLKAKTYDLRNSGDTAGYKSRVVGYGAYGFYA